MQLLRLSGKSFFKHLNLTCVVPYWQVEQIVARAKFPFKIIEFNREPLGVGTIAQVHLGKVQLQNGEITDYVFRFIKPNMREKALEEASVIEKACITIDHHPDVVGKNYPKLTSIADNSYAMIKQDLVLNDSVNNQKIGRRVYGRSDIDVPVVELSLDPEQLFMYSTKAPGKKISKYSVPVQRKLVNRVVEVWLEEAMFGSGYFHADLPREIPWHICAKTKGNNRYLKSFIDFGMFGRLTKNDRINLMGLGVAVKMGNGKNAKSNCVASIEYRRKYDYNGRSSSEARREV